jgi:hypothetical protein
MVSPQCIIPLNLWGRLYFKFLTPIIILLSCVALLIANVSNRNPVPTCRRFQIILTDSFLYVFFTLSSTLGSLFFTTSLEPFLCRENGSEWVFISDSTVSCFDSRWMSQVAWFGLFLILYLLIIPLSMFGVLHSNRDLIRKNIIHSWLNPLLKGYRLECYFWELFLLFRKAVFFTLAKLLSTDVSDSKFNLLVMVLFQIMFLGADMLVRPYRSDFVNNLNVL